MNEALLAQLQAAQEDLDPQFKTLRAATGALKRAVKLAGEDKLDALSMQKALVKLHEAAEPLDSRPMQQAVAAFASQTQAGLDALAFEFARDLKEVFEQRGQTVSGLPPTLVVDSLVLQIDAGARKARWFYGKEALTRPIPLSIKNLLKAYDQQHKRIVRREINVADFMQELYTAWEQVVAKRERRPPGVRVSIIETYSQITLNRQTNRFWNSPSRRTFVDYDRPLFVRDLVLAQAAPIVAVEGKTYHLRFSVATKNQAGSAARSLWLPQSALDGEYIADITFEKV